ncbi:glycosyltransferase family 2 protein [Flavobacterium subsaxonicum]|uniref:Glycosyltransferase 2-like domain-containing protein n=1 Tax=Flavobacterium subsaxonicum WB 4.1-42 = DSM 21790 TaxID=1121898 RepID=A0A0A2MM63_9FLAO|nr:glycosyltransferase [Flavobacterium subsaxonicum]KGO92578.1 hypothetical protein Q766_12450 [Flavobacterium subsaxonicum WB 4.1-42 = DSM 21790]
MLSVLIPTYNYNILPLTEVLLGQCLKANLVFEIIVADDGPGRPTAQTNKAVAQLPYCRFIENTTNLGRTLTRKNLAEAAQYNNLLFLDADVMPADEQFIERYVPYLNGSIAVVVGGYAYRHYPADNNHRLRLKYGISREQKTASERNKNPYGSIFSGNFLIDKSTFLQNNYPDNHNYYGMDIYFSYSLFIKKTAVVHIDNPIYHLGLESDAVFFKKSMESVKIRKQLLAHKEGIGQVNSLIKHYNTLKKLHLAGLATLAFKVTEPLLKKMIFKKDPNLFCMDLYRLGYICSLK